MAAEIFEQLIQERFALEDDEDCDAFLEAINTYINLMIEQDVLIDDSVFHQMLKYRCMIDKGSKETIQLMDTYIHKYLQTKMVVLTAQSQMGIISVWILPRFIKITLYLDINNNTIGYVKRRIHDLTGLPVEQQKLVHRGRVLEHMDYTLGQYQIERGVRIYMAYYKGVFPREPLKQPQSVFTGYEESTTGSEGDSIDWNNRNEI